MAAKALSFQVGDNVVYPKHGVGRVIEVQASEITPVYDDPESVQPFTEAQAIQMMVSSGIPLTSACKRMGWSETEVQELEADLLKQAASQQMSLAHGLIEAQKRFDQGSI